MYGESRRARTARTAIVIAAATVLALALPVGAPLFAGVYPDSNARTFDEAVDKANIAYGFEPPEVTQYETAEFRATIIYGTSTVDLDQPTVNIAFSNEAALTATEEGTFEIVSTSPSRRDLDAGTRRPDGGYEITWTWDVTPQSAGEHLLTLMILPTVIIEGELQENVANINEPIRVTVDVHPVQKDFEEVLVEAESMETDVPDDMVVGEQYDVSASLSLAGHADTVNADIELTQAETSAAVTILENPASALAAVRSDSVASEDQRVVRRWTVIPDEPGQVALVFTARIQGVAGGEPLEATVPKAWSARATDPPPSLWDRIQQPVLYVTPFVVLAGGLVALWAAWKHRSRKDSAGDPAEAPGDPAT